MESSTNNKLNFYRQLQEFFSRAGFLIHFNKNRVLYIDIDALKQRGFDVIIYYLKTNVDFTNSRCIDIESILFLSRLLNLAESRYWFTELEMTNLI